MKKILAAAAAVLLLLPSCLGDDNTTDLNEYEEWRVENLDYLTKAAAETTDGKLKYEKIVPDWCTGNYILMQWHNDRSLTANNLRPLSNSWVDVKYQVTDINGNVMDSSYSNKTPADSIFRMQPNGTVLGFWTAVTNMHVGDSVTAILPYDTGYGAYGSGSIQPYSTLIFGIKLVDIVRYETGL